MYIVNPNLIDKCSYNVQFDISFDMSTNTHDNVVEWCKQNIPEGRLWTLNFCSGSSFAGSSFDFITKSTASFEYPEDAALFKLTWG